MLAGEHAVLHGYPALCLAVSQQVHVTLTPHADATITLSSNAFPSFTVAKNEIVIQKPYQFVLGALQSLAQQLPTGCRIHIESEFSHTIGFGSSAAVTVATIKALRQWLNLSLTPSDILVHAREVVRKVQGRGSGADVAASTYGHVVYYHQHDIEPEVINVLSPLIAVYCGYKTSTTEVIQRVEQSFNSMGTHVFNDICQQIGTCTENMTTVLKQQNWPALGELMNQHFALQQALHVSDQTIDTIVATLLQQPTIYGAKISGSGLGDCVIALGNIHKELFPNAQLPQTQQINLYV
jgi:mevalonate kinase